MDKVCIRADAPVTADNEAQTQQVVASCPPGLDNGTPLDVDPSVLGGLASPFCEGLDPAVVRSASERACPRFVSMNELASSHTFLSTGCVLLDTHIGGGIPCGHAGVIELSGAAGTGKSQLALQIAFSAIAQRLVNTTTTIIPPSSMSQDNKKPTINISVILVLTEGKYPTERAAQIESFIAQQHGLEVGCMLSLLVIEKIVSADDLLAWTKLRLPYLLRECGAQLVLLDSIAALYRPEFEDALTRSSHLVHAMASLKLALRAVGGVCIAVNQVTQRFEKNRLTGTDLMPALGPTWSACVSMRIFLDKTKDATNECTRRLRVLHASHTPSGPSIAFEITDRGLSAVPG